MAGSGPVAGAPRHKQHQQNDSESTPAAARRGTRVPPSDPLSDRSTTALIRRTLCPTGDKSRDAQRPIDELLPPLTSRNDVDLQLYAFLAIILREFVQSWYGRITTDEMFVAEIVHTVAHCTRALEQRLRKVDLESMLLDEIPDLLERHITAYREAQHPIAETPIQINPREVYHALWPLPVMSPVPQPGDESTVEDQKRNEAAYRQLLVEAVLAVLLPTEDLENPCLTSLVGQIFSELIIGNAVANKAAQPWIIFEGICIVARVMDEKKQKRARKLIGAPPPEQTGAKKSSSSWSMHSLLLSAINLCLLVVSSVRFLVGAIASSSSLPPRVITSDAKGILSQTARGDPPDQAADYGSSTKTPVLEFRMWSSIGSLMELPSRMPWLHGFLSLVQHGAIHGPGRLGRLNGTIDRLLSHHIHAALSPSHLPPLLRTLRGVLFPNNAPGKPTLVPPSSDDELLALRRRAATALCSILPRPLAKVYLGGGPGSLLHASGDGDAAMVDQLEGLLMVFSDEYCNKHLLYGILELILVRLMPEIAEKGVEELLDERLG